MVGDRAFFFGSVIALLPWLAIPAGNTALERISVFAMMPAYIFPSSQALTFSHPMRRWPSVQTFFSGSQAHMSSWFCGIAERPPREPAPEKNAGQAE
jgi:hypothetical protein